MVPTSKGGCTMCTDNYRTLQTQDTLSKNSLNTMGRPVGLVAHRRGAIWATPDGQADIWGVGEGQEVAGEEQTIFRLSAWLSPWVLPEG